MYLICESNLHKKCKKGIKFKWERSDNVNGREEAYEKQGGRCFICGEMVRERGNGGEIYVVAKEIE